MEGGSIEVNGAGCVLTTRQCLLSPMRNPDLSEAEIEALLAAYLGTPRVLWLDTGLEGDHTDGHIDTITRFTDAQTIVTVTCEDRADANYEPTMLNLERLRGFSDADGQPFRVVELPLPRMRVEFDGAAPAAHVRELLHRERRASSCRSTATRTTNARSRFCARCFPSREVRGVMARHLITGGGAFHCVTQQQPAGVVTSDP